ncbi:MAG: cobaltochelatase CobT-related protein, partial [Alphaproteobacteria bacterium]
KGFGQPWRQPRLQVPGLCDAGLLKENIDHEALSWALRRLRLVPATRRVLVVISDGAPSCSTTERHAGGEALPQALRDLLVETSDVEIYALGLRHRAEAFYQRAVSITAETDLIPRLMDLTREIMTRHAAR